MTDPKIDAAPGIDRVWLLQTSSAAHWPTDSNVIRMVIRVATVLAGAGVLLGLFFIGQPANTLFIVGMILALAVPGIMLVGLVLWSQFFRPTQASTSSPDSLSNSLPRWTPKTDEAVGKAIALWFKIDPRPHPEVIAVCHPSITAIVGVQGPPHLLEAEPLVEGDVKILGGRLLLAAIMLTGLVIGIVALEGRLSGSSFIQLAPVLIFPAIPIGMMVVRRLRSMATPRFIIGAGFLRDTTADRVITVEDAVLYARPSNVTPHGTAFLMDVDLIGPDLRLRFQFRDPYCPEFQALWERWCHADPRPELAGGEVPLAEGHASSR